MSEPTSAKPVKQPHPLQKPVRIVLFALLAVAIGALVIDQIARKNADGAFQKIQAAMGEERDLKEVSREQVHELVGRAPDDDGDPKDNEETFTWQGGLRPQVLYVQYRLGGDEKVKDISLNEPPAGFGAD